MKIPEEVLNNLTEEEAKKLVRLYGTDLYSPYIKQLQEKYRKIVAFLQEVEDERS